MYIVLLIEKNTNNNLTHITRVTCINKLKWQFKACGTSHNKIWNNTKNEMYDQLEKMNSTNSLLSVKKLVGCLYGCTCRTKCEKGQVYIAWGESNRESQTILVYLKVKQKIFTRQFFFNNWQTKIEADMKFSALGHLLSHF